jgi:TM2 domain-containing membrane protein YozV
VVIADRVGWLAGLAGWLALGWLTGFWLAGWLDWLAGLAGWLGFGWQAINILTCLINFYRNQCVLEHIYKALLK